MDEGNYFADDDSPLCLDPFTITVTSDTTLRPGNTIRKRTIACSTKEVRIRLGRVNVFISFLGKHKIKYELTSVGNVKYNHIY